MGVQRGRNSGVTGLVDFPGLGAKFEVTVVGYKVRVDGQTKPRRGRGGGIYASIRWVFSGGSVAITYKIRGDGWPLPDSFKGQTGTITIQIDTGKTVAYPVIATSASQDQKESESETGYGVIACDLTGAPTYTGWSGTQPAATDPSKSNQEQWQGTSKVYDPSGLLTQATRLIDVWGTLTDTDAAEQTLIVSTISSSTPFTTPHNLKLRTRSFQRDALDGGTVVEVWGLTTTAEDDINSATERFVDANGIEDYEVTANHGSPPSPNDADLKAVGTSYKERNDSKTLQSKRHGRRDTLDNHEIPGEHTDSDPNDFGETATVNRVNSSSTPPSTPSAPVGQLIRIVSVPINRANGSYTGRWKHVFSYGPTTPKQLIEQEGQIDRDVSGLGGGDVQTLTNASSTPEADPATRISGMVIVKRVSNKLQNTPEKWKHVYVHDWLTPEQRIEHQGTSAGGSGLTPALSTLFNQSTDVDTCASGDDAAEIATSLYGANINDKYFERVDARKINTTHYQARTIRVNDDLLIAFSQGRISSMFSSVDKTGAYLNIASAYESGNGYYKVRLGGYRFDRIQIPFTIRRRYAGQMTLTTKLLISTLGKTNNATFLGFAQGSVRFLGSTLRDNYQLNATNHRQVVDYFFCVDDAFWPTNRAPAPGFGFLTAAASAPGAIAVGSIETTWTVETPVQADFSGFLT